MPQENGNVLTVEEPCEEKMSDQQLAAYEEIHGTQEVSSDNTLPSVDHKSSVPAETISTTCTSLTNTSLESEETSSVKIDVEDTPSVADVERHVEGENLLPGEDKSSVVEDKPPVPEDMSPVAEDESSVADKESPAAEDKPPVVEDKSLVAEDESSPADKMSPVADKESSAEVTKQHGEATDQETPVTQEDVPTSEEKSQVSEACTGEDVVG